MPHERWAQRRPCANKNDSFATSSQNKRGDTWPGTSWDLFGLRSGAVPWTAHLLRRDRRGFGRGAPDPVLVGCAEGNNPPPRSLRTDEMAVVAIRRALVTYPMVETLTFPAKTDSLPAKTPATFTAKTPAKTPATFPYH